MNQTHSFYNFPWNAKDVYKMLLNLFCCLCSHTAHFVLLVHLKRHIPFLHHTTRDLHYGGHGGVVMYYSSCHAFAQLVTVVLYKS